MRSMELRVKNRTIYESKFDPASGVIVRVVEVAERYDRSEWQDDEDFKKRYPRRHYNGAFSPVPETVDISITDRCGFGCLYCYQDSRPRRAHAPKELVEAVLTGFDQPPYQIAIGGGEPTQHPDFEYILRSARTLGTVPNYTTAGHAMTDRIYEVTNELCGGVAMTFHAFKGIDWFVEHYIALRKNLKVQVNVHLIADKDVAKNLNLLTNRFKELGPLNLVLLAYYQNVGRASLSGIMPKRVYMKDLPEAIQATMSVRNKVAFSEGLLPYFLSRPEIGVETKFALRSEGVFSCYFDPQGRISTSSFDPPHAGYKPDEQGTAFKVRAQDLWDGLDNWGAREPNGEACYNCPKEKQCVAHDELHMLACAFQPHNLVPLKDRHVDGESKHLRVLRDDYPI